MAWPVSVVDFVLAGLHGLPEQLFAKFAVESHKNLSIAARLAVEHQELSTLYLLASWSCYI